MKSRLLKAVCAACLLFNYSDSHAAIVILDLFSAGDGLITRDTNTNLDWLDVTATSGKSINDLLGGSGLIGLVGMTRRRKSN